MTTLKLRTSIHQSLWEGKGQTNWVKAASISNIQSSKTDKEITIHLVNKHKEKVGILQKKKYLLWTSLFKKWMFNLIHNLKRQVRTTVRYHFTSTNLEKIKSDGTTC